MSISLRYGANAAVELNLTPSTLLADCDAPRGNPLDNPISAVDAVLRNPLDFPALSQAIVPGDRVAIPIEPGLSAAPAVVPAVVDFLTHNNIEAADITLLRVAADPATEPEELRQYLPEQVRSQIAVVTHDPADRNALAYLGATKSGHPIYVNRFLGDADLVLPIGSIRLEPGEDCPIAADGLYPAFSDAKTQEQYRGWEASDRDSRSAGRARREAGEVAWLLGARFAIRIVPGGGDRILHILAGEVDKVAALGLELCEAAWTYRVPCRASLVVAAIEGDRSQQTWENVGRAVAAAARAVADDGAIVVCSELVTGPGPAMRRLAGADDLHTAIRQVRQSRFEDKLPATRLGRAMERSKVYLLSRLDESVVEELGVAAVACGEEVARLAGRHQSCILLANAQYAVATPGDE